MYFNSIYNTTTRNVSETCPLFKFAMDYKSSKHHIIKGREVAFLLDLNICSMPLEGLSIRTTCLLDLCLALIAKGKTFQLDLHIYYTCAWHSLPLGRPFDQPCLTLNAT